MVGLGLTNNPCLATVIQRRCAFTLPVQSMTNSGLDRWLSNEYLPGPSSTLLPYSSHGCAGHDICTVSPTVVAVENFLKYNVLLTATGYLSGE